VSPWPRAIAAAEGLPEVFLPEVLKPLAAGMLLPTKGQNGGYQLGRPGKRISLLEAVEPVGGPVRGDVPRWAADADGARLDARLQEVCDIAAGAVRNRLRRVSVADLARE
jgi:DNA-binding IscR family transcriptional regulator